MRNKPFVALLAAAALVATAACGADSTTAADDSASSKPASAKAEVVTLKVGVLPIATEAPLYVGIDQGFFAEEGLKIEPTSAQGGAALLPSVVAGQLDFGTSNPVSLFIAAAKGLPIQIIAQGARGAQTPDEDFSVLAVAGNSAIKTPADLAGKTIAVNTLGNLGEVVVKAALEAQGVDISGIKFLELPFSSMNAAIESGQIDAAWTNEPFLTEALANGERIITSVYAGTRPGLAVGMYFTSKNYADKHPDVVAKFQRAIQKSVEFSGKNPDVVRKIVPSYTGVKDDMAAKMRLPVWEPAVDEAGLAYLAELMVKYKIIDAPLDVKAALAPAVAAAKG